MANQQLIGLSGVSVNIAGHAVVSEVSLNILQGERIALVGRNGAGKSTLAALIAGRLQPDIGECRVLPRVSIGYLDQSPKVHKFSKIGDFVESMAVGNSLHSAQKVAAGLGFDPNTDVGCASGGEIRRAAIAATLSGNHDLLILDEPTNHLDLQAIMWLEEYLIQTNASVLLISHDRALLTAVTNRTFWLDRGNIRQLKHGFEKFEQWRDELLEKEATDELKLGRQIQKEASWAASGMKARRKRNQRRLAELRELRETQRAFQKRQDFGAIEFNCDQSKRRVLIEVENAAKKFEDRCIAYDFSLRVRSGDRVAISGPNGCGKTTLLRMICKEMQLDSGEVRHNENLKIARFDQVRDSDFRESTVKEFFATFGIGSDSHLNVGNSSIHTATYLKNFLFSFDQLESPVKTLSGGEQARLEFACLMARESNLLILDEPTNDLDVETLEILEEAVGNFEGAVILVTHDRDFMERVATSIVAFESKGKWTEYIGGWTENANKFISTDAKPNARVKTKHFPHPRSGKKREEFTFTEKYRLQEIENQLPLAEAKISSMSAELDALNAAEVKYSEVEQAYRKLSDLQRTLQVLEEEWIRLAEKQERSEQAG